MSAGPDTAWAQQHPSAGPGARAGYSRVTPRALTRLMEAIAADAFTVPASEVTARIEDDGGLLRVSLSVPVAVPPLLQAPTAPGDSLYSRAANARESIIAHALELAGTAVSRVDIRLTGIHQEKGARAQ